MKISIIQFSLAQIGCETSVLAISYQVSSCGPSLPSEIIITHQAVPTKTSFMMGKPLFCSLHPTGSLILAMLTVEPEESKESNTVNRDCSEKNIVICKHPWTTAASFASPTWLTQYLQTEPWICASPLHYLQGTHVLQTSATNNIKSHYDQLTWPDEIQDHTSPHRILIWIYRLHYLL